MNAPIYVTPGQTPQIPDVPTPPGREAAQLLRQLVALQQEQVGLLKAQAASQDNGNRWRSFLARWAEEFPNIGGACKQSLPTLERAYLTLVRDLTDRVLANGDGEHGDLEDEFVMGEFLDRFGIRLGQLGNILGQLSPLADAVPAEEKA